MGYKNRDREGIRGILSSYSRLNANTVKFCLDNTHDAIPYAWPARGAGVVLVVGGAPTEMIWENRCGA
jgi:hypothetical protein